LGHLNNRVLGAILPAFLVAVAIAANVSLVSAYAPQKGDYFEYSETITVNNGQGSYAGYTDQTQVNGMEQMTSVSGSVVSATYSSSYQYTNNQGSSTSSSSSGTYTWSSSNFTYVNGTDDQNGYSKPTFVWFAMNASLAVGNTFYVLNTQFTVMSKNYSLQLPTDGNKYVRAIQAEGTGQYQRDDAYGVFTASYTWYEYFEPSTGYIVGYSYVEQDSGQYQGQAGSFTYTDSLYATSTSYPLASASVAAASSSTNLLGTSQYVDYLIVLAIVLIVILIAVIAATRRRRRDTLPKHPYSVYTPPPAPSSTPSESNIDLGSKPPEQVVIRDVAMVNCKYCGTLIPTTVNTCPYCGGPRQ